MVRRVLDDEETFKYWVSLGDWRSYAKVCKHFHVGRRAVQKCATRNNWAKRLEAIEAATKKRTDELLTESRAEMRARHLRMLKAVATRGVQALQRLELTDAMQGVKAVETAIKWERTIMGEPNEAMAHSVPELTRREVESFLTVDDGSSGQWDDDETEAGDDDA